LFESLRERSTSPFVTKREVVGFKFESSVRKRKLVEEIATARSWGGHQLFKKRRTAAWEKRAFSLEKSRRKGSRRRTAMERVPAALSYSGWAQCVWNGGESFCFAKKKPKTKKNTGEFVRRNRKKGPLADAMHEREGRGARNLVERGGEPPKKRETGKGEAVEGEGLGMEEKSDFVPIRRWGGKLPLRNPFRGERQRLMRRRRRVMILLVERGKESIGKKKGGCRPTMRSAMSFLRKEGDGEKGVWVLCFFLWGRSEL